ncbi:MAG: hypothetical protein WCG99_01660 [Candidatus Berkelbacteria bacterium]
MIHNSFYFVLGRENKISQTELECVLASFDFGFSPANISILSDQVLEIKLEASSDQVKKLIEILGGTVKIFQKIAPANEKIENLLLAEDKSSKIIFGLSNYSVAKVDTFRMALSAKKAAKKSIRIIDGKEGGRLSSAQSFQYKMDIDNVEYGLFETGIGKLIAVQNINEWTRHDYGKPKSDAKSGMLPPKLARMMVNLAVGQVNDETRINNDEDSGSSFLIRHSGLRPLVVDPFCGSGNVLIEAVSVGCNVVGSDLSEKAVSDTKENLEWFLKSVIPDPVGDPLIVDSRLCGNDIVVADAAKFDFSDIKEDFIIATEPFLGQPRTSKLRIEEEAEAKSEITQLYMDFLRNLKLTANSQKLKAIAIVFPLFELANGKKLSIFNDCVDFIRDIGYTTVCPPLEYGRDYQVVKRQIVILKLSADS